MTNKNEKKPGSPGFSLIELLLLIAVAAILAAFAVPTFSAAMRDMQLAADARSISSALSVARIKSTSLINPYQVRFDLANNSWSIRKFNRSTSSWETEQDVNELSSGLAGSGISFVNTSSTHPGAFPTGSSNWITFNARGIPINLLGLPTPNNIIYLSNSDTDFAVTVTLTGKVQIWKKEGSTWTDQ